MNCGNSGAEKREDVWSDVRKLPQNQSNLFVCLSVSKDPCVGTKSVEEGTHVLSAEAKIDMMITMIVSLNKRLNACSNTLRRVSSQGKEDHSCLQGTRVKLDTSNILNGLSVSDSLSLCELNDSLPYFDNVYTLVNLIDDRIDSSSKIDLCPSSVDTCDLIGSTLSCETCVDQLVCDSSSPLIKKFCDVINEPQFRDNGDIVGHSKKSNSLSISLVEDPITSFAHRGHVFESALRQDICPF